MWETQKRTSYPNTPIITNSIFYETVCSTMGVGLSKWYSRALYLKSLKLSPLSYTTKLKQSSLYKWKGATLYRQTNQLTKDFKYNWLYHGKTPGRCLSLAWHKVYYMHALLSKHYFLGWLTKKINVSHFYTGCNVKRRLATREGKGYYIVISPHHIETYKLAR